MNREQKILKAALLTKQYNKVITKEEIRTLYQSLSDKVIDKCIEELKNPQENPESLAYREESNEDASYYEDTNSYRSCTAGDYGPSNPWDAPGMSISDFI